MTVEDRRASVGAGISVAQRQAARPFVLSISYCEKAMSYTMASTGLWNINVNRPQAFPSGSGRLYSI